MTQRSAGGEEVVERSLRRRIGGAALRIDASEPDCPRAAEDFGGLELVSALISLVVAQGVAYIAPCAVCVFATVVFFVMAVLGQSVVTVVLV